MLEELSLILLSHRSSHLLPPSPPIRHHFMAMYKHKQAGVREGGNEKLGKFIFAMRETSGINGRRATNHFVAGFVRINRATAESRDISLLLITTNARTRALREC